jgi:hypothetical protein
MDKVRTVQIVDENGASLFLSFSLNFSMASESKQFRLNFHGIAIPSRIIGVPLPGLFSLVPFLHFWIW